MRTVFYILPTVWLVLSLTDHQSSVLASPQAGPTKEELVEQFERAGLGSQMEFGKQIVGLGDRRLLVKLERWLGDEDRHVRANVAFVFASLADPRGFEVLSAILTDRSDRREGQGVATAKWSVARQIEADRYYAVHVLGHVKDSQSVDLLLPLLTDEQVNYKAAWALGEIGDKRAIPPLIESLRDEDALVRISAIQALAKLHAKEALPRLRTLLDDRALPRAGDQRSVRDTAKAAILAIERER